MNLVFLSGVIASNPRVIVNSYGKVSCLMFALTVKNKKETKNSFIENNYQCFLYDKKLIKQVKEMGMLKGKVFTIQGILHRYLRKPDQKRVIEDDDTDLRYWAFTIIVKDIVDRELRPTDKIKQQMTEIKKKFLEDFS